MPVTGIASWCPPSDELSDWPEQLACAKRTCLRQVSNASPLALSEVA